MLKAYKQITARIIFAEITDPKKTVKQARVELMRFVSLLIFEVKFERIILDSSIKVTNT